MILNSFKHFLTLFWSKKLDRHVKLIHTRFKPFLPGESEPPKKWTKKEEKDLWEGVTQCKTKDVMTAVRKEVDREPDPGKKVELMKKKLGRFSRGQY